MCWSSGGDRRSSDKSIMWSCFTVGGGEQDKARERCACVRACVCACERVCSPASQMFPIFNSPFAPLDLQESVRFCRSSLPPYQRALPHYLFVSSRRFTGPLMSTFPERSGAGFAAFRRLHPSCQSSDLKCFQSVLCAVTEPLISFCSFFFSVSCLSFMFSSWS